VYVCSLLSLIMCLLKRLSNSHLLMSFVSIVGLYIFFFRFVSLLFSVCHQLLSVFLLLFCLFFFHCSTYFSSFFYIYIIIIISLHTIVLVSRLHPISKRRSTRQKHIDVYGNKNKLQLVFF